ncbi:MAG: DUF92 domain-containing protein [Candidatus Hermodarchaeota archaeon]
MLQSQINELFLIQFGIGLLLNALVMGWATSKKALRVPDGILAAFSIGVILFTFTPMGWLLMLTFFLSASFLTKYKHHLKEGVQEKFDKGGRRDAWQVLANSATTLVIAVLIGWYSLPDLISPLFFGLAAYFASTNADTFSTEVGILAKSDPRWILNPRQTVEKGTSGGVTLLGTLAGAIGALEIGIMLFIGTLIFPTPGKTIIDGIIAIGVVTFAGMVGNFVDSLLGATVQGFYYCPTCELGTEKKIHLKCGGTKTQKTRGLDFFTNDWVNLIAATIGSLVAIFLGYYLFLGL